MDINSASTLTSSPFASLSSVGTSSTEKSFGKSDSSLFAPTLKSVIETLDGQQKGAEQEIAHAVGGESPDIHKTLIALQTADLHFQFALQVRNKFISAFEEIMRMQV